MTCKGCVYLNQNLCIAMKYSLRLLALATKNFSMACLGSLEETRERFCWEGRSCTLTVSSPDGQWDSHTVPLITT